MTTKVRTSVFRSRQRAGTALFLLSSTVSKLEGDGTRNRSSPEAGPDLNSSTPLVRSALIFSPIMAIRCARDGHCEVASRMLPDCCEKYTSSADSKVRRFVSHPVQPVSCR
jgi:hypothetical protein